MTDYVETYKCKKCHLTASGRGHLCHPNEKELPFTCEFCKEKTDNARHVCKAMLDSIEYVCKKCGRLAPYDSLLCYPELVAGD